MLKIKKLFGNIWNSIKAFPLSHLLLLSLTVFTIIWIYGDWTQNLRNLMISNCLALLLSAFYPIYALHVWDKGKSKLKFWLWIIIPILAFVAYYLILSNVTWDTYAENIKYFGIFVLVVIWLFLLIAIISQKKQWQTWYSWLSLVLTPVLWAIACWVIWWWISWALASVEALFDVYIESEVYQVVRAISWLLISWSFMINYFQYLISNEWKIQDSNMWNSRLRKIFGNYIFLWLTIIYISIFVAYAIKILVTWVWPRWIIVWLWIWYFVLWLITTFLMHPQDNKFSNITAKSIDVSCLFTSCMMIWAIAKRIIQYGVTINRYFVCWVILLIVVYSILSLIKTEKRWLILSWTLFWIALLCMYWPINAKHISLISQTKRLNNLLATNNIELPLLTWSFENLTWDDADKLYYLFDELLDNYDIKDWNKWYFTSQTTNDFDLESLYSKRTSIMKYLWLSYPEYKGRYDYNGDFVENIYYHTNTNKFMTPLDVSWYSKFYDIDAWWDDSKLEKNVFTYQKDWYVYTLDLNLYKEDLISRHDTGDDPLIIETDSDKLMIMWFNGELKNWEELTITSFYGYLLVK